MPGAGQGGRDEAHGDRRAEAGREAAAGDPADDRAVGVGDLGALAGRRAFQHLQARRARASGRRPARARCARAPGKSPASQPALGEGEGQAGLDRRDGLVGVVAIERQAGLQPQRIARAQADRLDPRVGQQRVPGLDRGDRRRGPGSRSRPRRCSRSARRSSAAPNRSKRPHSMKPSSPSFGQDRRHHRGGLRPLQGDQRAVVGRSSSASRAPASRSIRAKSSSLVPALTTMNRPSAVGPAGRPSGRRGCRRRR